MPSTVIRMLTFFKMLNSAFHFILGYCFPRIREIYEPHLSHITQIYEHIANQCHNDNDEEAINSLDRFPYLISSSIQKDGALICNVLFGEKWN